MIALRDIEEAAVRLSAVLRPTPTTSPTWLSELVGRPVLCKPEHLQRTGSFKIRGAYNFIAKLVESQPTSHVVAASAGNHAQGVALGASLCGLASTVFMPVDAALPKIQATRGYGARVILEGEAVDDCIDIARTYASDSGAVFVPPFDDDAIIAGQGTIGLELAQETAGATVIVPIGGGGLIGGIAMAIKSLQPDTHIVGVEASGAASMSAALKANEPVVLSHMATMADGIAVRSVSTRTLEYAKAYVDEIVTVEEEAISQAVLLLLERSKWLVEPAGAVGLAAALSGQIADDGPVAVVLSGGNIDPLLLTKLVEHGLTAAGRYVTVRVVLDDHPGELARLTAAVADFGLNVLSVEHHRSGANVGVHEVEVLMTLETRDPVHRDEIVDRLRDAGFRAKTIALPEGVSSMEGNR